MTSKIFALAATAALLLGATAAKADAIQLFNTGVDSAGAPLLNNVVDSHYALVSGPEVVPLRAATSLNNFPNTNYPIYVWGGDDGISDWIGPVGDAILSGPVGTYDYRTTFTLSGLNAATALITGRWATDDAGVNLFINGISTGQIAGFATDWTNFTVNSGFVAGTNTLDFIVVNSGGPTGLRVEMSGTADSLGGGVPEPATWGMMLVGFGGMGALLRSRRNRVALAA